MTIHPHTLKTPTKKRAKPRRGRGLATGSGKYSGRGMKGQKSRSGSSGLREMALRRAVQQIPKKRGFKAIREKPETVTLAQIQDAFVDGAIITPKTLKSKGLVKGKVVKIIGAGSLKKKISIRSCLLTQGARKTIIDVGGSIAE